MASLSEREFEVLKMAAQGLTDDRIAARLGISVATVRGYWLRVRGKLGGRSRTELVGKWIQLNSNSEGDRAAQEQKIQLRRQLEEIQRLLAAERAEVDRVLQDVTPDQRNRVREIRSESDRAMRSVHTYTGSSPSHEGLE